MNSKCLFKAALSCCRLRLDSSTELLCLEPESTDEPIPHQSRSTKVLASKHLFSILNSSMKSESSATNFTKPTSRYSADSSCSIECRNLKQACCAKEGYLCSSSIVTVNYIREMLYEIVMEEILFNQI